MAANKIQVEDKNGGTKIEWVQNKTKITFGDDDRTANCATRQREQDINVDICYDSEKNLVIGASGAVSYVAQILIPGFKYDESEVEEEVLDTEGKKKKEKRLVKTQKGLDMGDVVLTLWSID